MSRPPVGSEAGHDDQQHHPKGALLSRQHETYLVLPCKKVNQLANRGFPSGRVAPCSDHLPY